MRVWCSQVCTRLAFTALNIRLGELLAVTKRIKWTKQRPPGARSFREIGDQAADLPQQLLAALGGRLFLPYETQVTSDFVGPVGPGVIPIPCPGQRN